MSPDLFRKAENSKLNFQNVSHELLDREILATGDTTYISYKTVR